MGDLISGILLGAGAGAVAGAIGYLKAKTKEDPEGFEPKKFGLTVGVAAVIGGISAYMGVFNDPLALVGGTIGIGGLVENILKTINQLTKK